MSTPGSCGLGQQYPSILFSPGPNFVTTRLQPDPIRKLKRGSKGRSGDEDELERDEDEETEAVEQDGKEDPSQPHHAQGKGPDEWNKWPSRRD
ncbi:hypothetical protein FRC05_011011 [Tulasnella sp. 425]|nr:hypothetical protein FRC05_011011 [Tulasnella sp. 425]